MPELVEHGQTGLIVERGDSEKLAAALCLLLSDASLRERMGAVKGGSALSPFPSIPCRDTLGFPWTNPIWSRVPEAHSLSCCRYHLIPAHD